MSRQCLATLVALAALGTGANAFSPSVSSFVGRSTRTSPRSASSPSLFDPLSLFDRTSKSPVLGLRAAAAALPAYPNPTILEAKEEASATVIFLHGLGDSGSGWKRLGEAIGIPWVKWVYPTASIKPITISGGAGLPGWFDIQGLKVSEMRADSDGIQESINYVLKLVEEEMASGTPSDRIVLGGFSQGGLIALGAAMQADVPLGGVMALSTWFPRGIADKPTAVNEKMPVLVSHGEKDPVAKAEWGRKTFEYVSELGMPTDGNIYPDMGHEFKSAQVPDMKAFLLKTIGNQIEVSVSKPLGLVLQEGDDRKVSVGGLKEGGNGEKSGKIEVGDIVLAINDKIVKTSGFDAVMDSIIQAEGDLKLRILRPIKDRSAAWTDLSEEEQERRFNTAGGIIKVCTDRSCMNQGSKATMRWLTELTPETFSVTRCSCTGSCGKGPNVVVAGKGKPEKVVYETSSVGSAVKMLREEFDLQPDPEIVNQLLNPSKNIEFAMSDELVRQGLMQTVDVRSSFAGNRF